MGSSYYPQQGGYYADSYCGNECYCDTGYGNNYMTGCDPMMGCDTFTQRPRRMPRRLQRKQRRAFQSRKILDDFSDFSPQTTKPCLDECVDDYCVTEPTCVAPTCVAPTCVAPTCVAPTCVAPTCVAPSCVAPSCVAPGCAAPPVCDLPACAAPDICVPDVCVTTPCCAVPALTPCCTVPAQCIEAPNCTAPPACAAPCGCAAPTYCTEAGHHQFPQYTQSEEDAEPGYRYEGDIYETAMPTVWVKHETKQVNHEVMIPQPVTSNEPKRLHSFPMKKVPVSRNHSSQNKNTLFLPPLAPATR